MTTRPAGAASSPTGGFVRLPDPPEPEDMNNHLYFNSQGNSLHLARHLGNVETTLIIAGVYVSPEPTGSRLGLFEPDLIIAFDVDPAACGPATATSSRNRGNRRTLCWKSARAARAGAM